jgi:hypothetical protein
VIKALFMQMILIVFPQYFYLAAKIIVWTLHQLELALLSVPFEILSLYL